MTLSCTARALRFSLFVFNLVFLLCGIVCVGIGTWLVLDKYAIDNLALATAQIQGYEQEEALRDLYATCLMIILATEIAAAIYAAMHSNMFENDFREILRASLRMYNGTDNSSKKHVDGMLMKAAWDKLMMEKSCCGVDSKVGEFNESGWFHLTRGRYMFPPACCPRKANGKLKRNCHPYARHGDGCITHMYRQNRLQFSAVFGVIFVLSALQVFGCILCTALYDRIKKEMLYYY